MIENLKNWWKAEKYNILLTIFAALIPLMIDWGVSWEKTTNKESSSQVKHQGENTEYLWWAMSEKSNYAIQTIFIGITLFVLIRTRHATTNELVNSKGQIIQYILKNCSLKSYNDESKERTYSNVKEMVRYFYIAWLIVWFLWLAYYLGNYFLAYQDNVDLKFGYRQIVNFLNSSAMFGVYTIIGNTSISTESKLESFTSYWFSFLGWFVLFVCCLVGVFIDTNNPDTTIGLRAHSYVIVLNAMFSIITMVLVLGKLNSVYLQIPRLFMWVLYLYAAIQAYTPLLESSHDTLFMSDICDSTLIEISRAILPYVTLFGKVFLMLVLCWVVDYKRLIFFVIHRSVTIEQTPRLLNELNRNHVSF